MGIVVFLQMQPAEALHPLVIPVVTTLIAAIKQSLVLFQSVQSKHHNVHLPLESSEEFNTQWKDGKYLVREDWTNLRPKVVKINEGLHDLGSSVENLEEDMEEGFKKV